VASDRAEGRCGGIGIAPLGSPYIELA